MKKIFFLLLLFTSCASNEKPTPSSSAQAFPEKKIAPQFISASLKPAGDPALAEARGSSITLRKSSLGKAFLLSITMSSSTEDSTPQILLPKIVSFETNGSELALMEQNIYSIYNEIPSAKLLQAFPVEKEDAETITFKWAYGLASIPVKSFSVSGARPETGNVQTEGSEVAYPATASYLRSAKIKENRLELRQVMRIRSLEGKLVQENLSVSSREESVQLDFAISPYVPNPRFQKRISTRLKGVGFFEIAGVRKEEGNIDFYASRWDLSKEAGLITYAISKNTPPEAVEAMREGLEYWNEVSKSTIGREIIKVETGADPQEALKPRTVMVYWVPYANAGSAFANFQPDPLTGEITSGLIYQTSVFFLSGKIRGRRWVNRGVENNRSDRTLVPVGFRPADLCKFSHANLVNSELSSPDLEEKISMKMGFDYLRFVLAHESGHTLGLRHNFAGSLGSELTDPAEAREKLREYLNDERHPGAITSSSVMDYITFRDLLLLGSAIKNKKTLSYDKAAILWAYSEEAKSPSELRTPFYCPDEENGKFVGCSTGDTGQKPITGFAWELARSRLLAPYVAADAILDAIRPDNSNDQKNVKKALSNTHPDSLSTSLAADAGNIMKAGLASARSLPVDRMEDGPSWINQKDYLEKNKAYFSKAFEDAGGLPGLLKVAYDLDADFHAKSGWMLATVKERMARPDFGRGKTLNGKPYEITGAELEEAKAAIEKLGEALESAHLRDLLLFVTGLDAKAISGESGKGTMAAYQNYGEGMKVYDASLVQDSWQDGLGSLGSQLALESEGELEGTMDGNPIKVPLPKFKPEVRVSGMRLLAPKVFSRNGSNWLPETAAKIDKDLIERLSRVIQLTDNDPEKVEPKGKLSKELVEWARTELLVLKSLRAARR